MGKDFSQAGLLIVDLKIEKKKLYKCNLCQKGFVRGSYLKTHIESVHENKKYKCKLCLKEFLWAKCLKIHIETIHEKTKNYECKSCKKIFNQVGNLKTHINNVHKQLRSKCKICQKLVTKGFLKSHIES